MSNIYHSALRDELDFKDELGYYEKNGSFVFAHDLTKGAHPLYLKAGAIYSEPAWNKGYNLFLDRAGVGRDSAHNDYLAAINMIIGDLRLPTFIIMGKHMIKSLKPEYMKEMKINKGNCVLGIWNTGAATFKTNEEVIGFVSDNYDNVLDFSCGYGNLARAMIAKGKNFICSDINKKCVYYIAREIM